MHSTEQTPETSTNNNSSDNIYTDNSSTDKNSTGEYLNEEEQKQLNKDYEPILEQNLEYVMKYFGTQESIRKAINIAVMELYQRHPESSSYV